MIIASLLVGLTAQGTPYKPLPVTKAPEVRANGCAGGKALKAAPEARPGHAAVAALPFSMGRRFTTLDDYLTHLRCRAAPIDLPWWREIRPGVYEHVKRLPGGKREVATRADLMNRFGFSR